MKDVWIHAGMPKSGSSALQVFFARNRERLLSEGLDYLALTDLDPARNGGITSGNGGFLARSLLSPSDEAYCADDRGAYARLLEGLAKTAATKCLVSSEFFAGVGEAAYARLLADLRARDCHVKLLYYVRRQDQALVSAYMQRVKRHGYSDHPQAFVQATYRSNPLLRYYDTAMTFEGLFGPGNLVVGLYETTERHPRGIVGDFLEKVLGHCPDWVAAQPAVNTSPSPLELKLMLIANQYDPRMRFSDILARNSAQTLRSRAYGSHDILAPDVVDEVLDYFSEQNALFADRYANGETFPEYEASSYVDLAALPLDASDTVAILIGFLVNFDRRLARLEQLAKQGRGPSSPA